METQELDGFVNWLEDYIADHRLCKISDTELVFLRTVTRSGRNVEVGGDFASASSPDDRPARWANSTVASFRATPTGDSIKLTVFLDVPGMLDYVSELCRSAIKDGVTQLPVEIRYLADGLRSETIGLAAGPAKRGAPALAELDDAAAEVKKEKLREFLRLTLSPRAIKREIAAQRAGVALSTLRRYERAWPEVVKEVEGEFAARKAQKV